MGPVGRVGSVSCREDGVGEVVTGAIEGGGGASGDGRAAGNGHVATASGIPVDWEGLARADAHPMRISILEILGIDGGRTLSPSDLCAELQAPLANANYHVTELAKAGLVELTDKRQVRGAVENFYRLPPAEVCRAADPR